MDTSEAQQIAQEFAPVGVALHDAMPQAIGLANNMMKLAGLEIVDYRSTYIHNIVACTHHVAKRLELGEWQLNSNARKKQFHLSKGLWNARLLASTYDDRIPTAGRNRAREIYYTNPPIARQDAQQALIERHDFLVVWTFNPETCEVELELVHTIGPWRHGQRERVDFRMMLTADSVDVSNLKFTPADDDNLDGLGLGEIDDKGKYLRGAFDGRDTSS